MNSRVRRTKRRGADTDDGPPNVGKRITQVYRPPSRDTGWSLETHVGHDRVRYFRLGRHALAAGLQLMGVKTGDTVLIPEFICREILSAVHHLGAEAAYYPVDRYLAPSVHLSQLGNARAVVAVNYFGFPQDLGPFRSYCQMHGAALVEDNAHGLLSRTPEGAPLGTRGDLGVFSLRKTVNVADGGALTVNRSDWWRDAAPQLEPRNSGQSPERALKAALRTIEPALGVGTILRITRLRRALRRMARGQNTLSSSRNAETVLPPEPAPPVGLVDRLAHVDEVEEVARRRELYAWLLDKAGEMGVEPLFSVLPAGTAPYGFPFYCSADQRQMVVDVLSRWHLECFSWPELPTEADLPHWYNDVMMVSFLW